MRLSKVFTGRPGHRAGFCLSIVYRTIRGLGRGMLIRCNSRGVAGRSAAPIPPRKKVRPGFRTVLILNRGAAGRNCGNMLVFLAADKTRLVDLDKAVRSYMAWQSIDTSVRKPALETDGFRSGHCTNRTCGAKSARDADCSFLFPHPGSNSARTTGRYRTGIAGRHSEDPSSSTHSGTETRARRQTGPFRNRPRSWTGSGPFSPPVALDGMTILTASSILMDRLYAGLTESFLGSL